MILPSTSIFAQAEDRIVQPSTINRWGVGKGGGRICVPKFQILKVNSLPKLEETLSPFHKATFGAREAETVCLFIENIEFLAGIL
jgi:hypothetical protein